MKRSRKRELVGVNVLPVTDGVDIATAFVHPDRGLVLCPASPILGGILDRAGARVQYSDWTVASSDDIRQASTVTYIQRDGEVVGLAALAGSPRFEALVAAAIADCSRVLRSRRIVLATPQPWCSGLKSAFAAVDRLAGTGRPAVYVLGEPPPTPSTAARLQRRGVVFVDGIDRVPDGARVIIGSAGVSIAQRAIAGARGLDVIDATCSIVAAAAREVREFAEQGETVVVVGSPGHAALPGLAGQAPERVRLVTRRRDVPAIEADPERVAVVVTPGAPLSETMPVAEEVRRRFGHIIPQHPATICPEPSDRAAAIRRLTTEVDVVFVVGPACPDLDLVVRSVDGAGVPVHAVSRPEDVELGWLEGAGSLGITAALSAEPELVDRLSEVLSGLGPGTVVELTARTTQVTRSGRRAHVDDGANRTPSRAGLWSTTRSDE